MNLIHDQIETIKAVFQKHEKYHYFSGTACIIVGILWLLNKYLNFKTVYSDDHQVLSWVVVAGLAIIIAVILTFGERKKRNKVVANLAIKTVAYRLIFICLGTWVLMWIFYQNLLIVFIPTLFMYMYGLLILTSKDTLPVPIQYFGYLNFTIGLIGFLFPDYIIYSSALVLGLGHIVLGITLIINEKQYS